jgi:hypothetical protein
MMKASCDERARPLVALVERFEPLTKAKQQHPAIAAFAEYKPIKPYLITMARDRADLGVGTKFDRSPISSTACAGTARSEDRPSCRCGSPARQISSSGRRAMRSMRSTAGESVQHTG